MIERLQMDDQWGPGLGRGLFSSDRYATHLWRKGLRTDLQFVAVPQFAVRTAKNSRETLVAGTD
jgi:hypothetical protein